MKKKYIIIIISIIFFSLCLVGMIFLLPKVNKESIAYNTTIEDLFKKNGNFYVYFKKNECPFCTNIEKDIEKLKKTNTVYEIDSEACRGIKNYDWSVHEKKFDIMIGEKDNTGNITFYDGLDQTAIKEKYPELNYKIVWVNENYAELHEGKEPGKIYAVSTHPMIDSDEMKPDHFVVGGVPTLVEFDNHRVKNIYFDDKEIIDFMKSSRVPLDKYWNLD